MAVERSAGNRHEFFGGEIIAMAGASRRHGRIVSEIGVWLNNQFRDRNCQEFTSEMRIWIESNHSYVYPDVVALCGEAIFQDDIFDSLTNPQLIIEVLSPSTESVDRGIKFQQYRNIKSLTDYVLVAHDRVSVEHFSRSDNGSWKMLTFTDVAKKSALKRWSAFCHLLKFIAKSISINKKRDHFLHDSQTVTNPWPLHRWLVRVCL